jgi:hypothetical protein
MERLSGRRPQVEPFAALAAVFVVGIAAAVYAGAFEAAFPGPTGQSVAEATVDRVERDLGSNGVLDPASIARAGRLGPEGYHLNLTLAYADTTVTRGPAAPAAADLATRRVSVRVGFGDVRPGRLEVRVWS